MRLVRTIRFLLALAFTPRSLRDATVEAWVQELQVQAARAELELLLQSGLREYRCRDA